MITLPIDALVQVNGGPALQVVEALEQTGLPYEPTREEFDAQKYVAAVRLVNQLVKPGAVLLALPRSLPAARAAVVAEYLSRAAGHPDSAGADLIGVTIRQLRYIRQQQRKGSAS